MTVQTMTNPSYGATEVELAQSRFKDALLDSLSNPDSKKGTHGTTEEHHPTAANTRFAAASLRQLVDAAGASAWRFGLALKHVPPHAPTLSDFSAFHREDQLPLRTLFSAAEQAGVGEVEFAMCRLSKKTVQKRSRHFLEGMIEPWAPFAHFHLPLKVDHMIRPDGVELKGELCDFRCDSWGLSELLLPFQTELEKTTFESSMSSTKEIVEYVWVAMAWPKGRTEEIVSVASTADAERNTDASKSEKAKEKDLLARLEELEAETEVAPPDQRVPCGKWSWGRFKFGHVIERKLDGIMKSDSTCGWISGFDGVPVAREFAEFIEEKGPRGMVARAAGRGARAFVYVLKPEEGSARACFDFKLHEMRNVQDEIEEVQERLTKVEPRKRGMSDGAFKYESSKKIKTDMEEAARDNV